MAFRIFKRLSELLDVNTAGAADGDALTYDTATSKWIPGAGGGGGGAPTDVDYLVGTASGSLSAEIVVGASPGGELGGTWASPTVDTTHSGSSHASVQAAAEATAAAALLAHTTDSSDAHDASAISVLDAANDFTATDVEGALAELQSDHETDAQNLADHLADAADAHAGSAITNTPAGTIAATTVQAAINELDSEKATAASAVMDGDAAGGVLSGTYPNPGFVADMATQAELDAHVNDVSAAHAASAISADSTTLVGTGTDVQAVLEELDNGIADHLADATAAHAATAIAFTPAGTIAATTVQAAIEEVASEAGGGGGTGTVLLMPGAATLPDGSANNAAAGLIRVKGTEADPKKHVLALTFDGNGGIEHAWWDFIVPADYASGGELDLFWMLDAVTNAVKWQARVGAVTPDDADTPVEHAQAAAATVTTNVNATEARRLTKSTITLTMDSAAALDFLTLVVFRDSTDGADTATQDAELVGAVFRYTKT